MDSQVIYKSGGFAYRLVPDWARFPAEMRLRAVCGVTAIGDSIYAAVRSEIYPIAVFDRDGGFIRGFGRELDFNRIHGISADPDGTLWCCDDGNNRIYHLDTGGKVLHTLGGPDQRCDNGYDPTVTWPHDLYTITRAGEPFNRPTQAVRAADGELFVADGYGNTSVHRFDAELNLLATWGGPGREPGRFRLPHALWPDRAGRIWVADRENDRVQVFDRDGGLLKNFEKLFLPSELWGDGEFIYVVENRAGIAIFDMEPKMVARLGYPGCPLGTHGLGGDSDGNLYLGGFTGDYTLMKLEKLG